MDLRAAVQPSWELPILGPTALDREENRGRGMEGAGAEPSTSNGAPIFLQDYARRKSQDFAGGLRSTDRWPSHKSMACVRWQKLKSHARDVARSRRALKRIGSLPPLVLLTTSVAKGSLSNQLSMLNKLSREDWSPKERIQRTVFLSSVMQVHDILCSTGGGIQEFGRIFFDDLFRNDPELRDRLFREHSIGVLVFRLEVMISEMLRLARLERPLDLAAQATEVALSFLENGLQEEDLENCKSTALDTLRKVMVGRGSKWGRAQAKACVWLLDLLAALVLETLWTAGPKAKLVRDTWRSLCSELAPKDGGHGAVVSSPALSTTQKGFGLQALSYQGTSGKSGLLSAISRSNRVIPGAESLLPAEGPGSGNHGTTRFRRPSFSSTAPLLPPSHQDRQSPISPHIHAEADQQGPDRPRGLSRKISSVIEMISSAFAGQSSGPNDTLANPTSPNLTEEASGIRHPSPATRDLIKTSVAISRVRGKFKALLARKSEFETGEGMQMWKKKATASGISKEYVLGRRNAGRMLVSALVGLGRPGRLLCDVLGAGTQSVADEAGLLMEIIANACTRPYLLSQRVRVMAVAYSRTGLTPAMLHFFEDSILNVLETALAPAGKWPPGAAESWTWAWQAVQHSMLQHMGRANNVLTALQRSWGLIRQNGLEMKLAERFYDKMLSSHTNKMQSIFSRPKQMQYALFTQALDLVVRSVQDPEHMRTEVESLAMKHIKYNITREHVDIFGQLLIEALQDTLGNSLGPEGWSTEIEEAWQDTYNFTAEVFSRIITAGNANLVSRALAAGSIDALQHALEQAPRGHRAYSAVVIEADEATISPIIWTIRDGKLDFAEVLLRDILTIRGDRSHYYYGRDVLWENHPELLHLLVEKAPKLLKTVLDGHLWTSKFLEDGKRRVNYYIRDLYGDPNVPEMNSVGSTMLGLFVYRLPMNELHLFSHPLTTFLVDLKWRLFARRSFITMQALNVCNLLFAMAYLEIGAANSMASLVLALIQMLFALVRLVMHFGPLLKQLRQTSSWRPIRLPFGLAVRLPWLFQDGFVMLNMLTGFLCITMFVLTWLADPFGWKKALGNETANQGAEASVEPSHRLPGHDMTETWAMVVAFTAGLLWLQVVEFLKANTKLSALYYATVAVMSDVLRFLVVLGLLGAGLSVAMYWLIVAHNIHDGQAYEDAADTGIVTGGSLKDFVFYVFLSFLGITSLEEPVLSSWLIRILFASSVLISVVVVLNLLVSTMVSTYDLMQRSCNELAVKSLAELVVRSEEALTSERRKAIFASLNLDSPLEFEKNDFGPSGGMQLVRGVNKLQHEAHKVLDRVERYGGDANPNSPWDTALMISGPVFEGAAVKDSMQKAMEVRLADMETRLTSKILLELDGIKSALNIGSDGSDEDDGIPMQ